MAAAGRLSQGKSDTAHWSPIALPLTWPVLPNRGQMSALDIPQQLRSVAHPRGDRNGKETARAGERLVHELVGDRAATAPETLAVAGDGGRRGDRLTYRELDRRANQLANHLRT